MTVLFIRIIRRIFWIVCKLLPVKRNKVLFQSYYGRGYSDNPKYIAEQLLAGDVPLDLVWVTNGVEPADTPAGFRTVKFRTLRYIYEISTARVWVDNARKEYCLKKKNQFYMQCWHGGLALKRIEKAVADKLDPIYIRMAKMDSRFADVMLSNCDTMTRDIRENFWYPEGDILQKGLPRNDCLVNFRAEDTAAKKVELGLQEDIHYILYAPTFRRNHSLAPYNMDYARCCRAFEQRFGGEWKLLLRLHPNIFKLAGDLQFDQRYVVNATAYPDIQQLYMASDCIITDYSSVIFDFMLLDRPAFLYASDIEEYRQDRDNFFDLFSLPFSVSQDNDELEQNIRQFDEQTYFRRMEEFRAQQGMNETGKASQYAAQWILDKIR